MRYSVLLSALVVIVLAALTVEQSQAVYPYAIKGFVRDVRRKPHLFIGGWALKKFIKLKLIKLKFKAKKFIVKKTIKAAIIFALLSKIRRRIGGGRLFSRLFNQRAKRQAEDIIPFSPEELNEYLEYYDYQDLPGKEPSDEEALAFLNMANELDSHSCLPKGVCEVVAKGNGSHLNHFEHMVYDVYGEGNRPKSPRDSPLYVYEYAAYVGKSSRDPRACDTAFKSCTEQRQSLNNFMESTFTSEMCDYPDDQIQLPSRIGFYTEPPPGFKFESSSSNQQSQRLQNSQPVLLPRKTGTIKFENK